MKTTTVAFLLSFALIFLSVYYYFIMKDKNEQIEKRDKIILEEVCRNAKLIKIIEALSTENAELKIALLNKTTDNAKE